jgi:hypothetical protein
MALFPLKQTIKVVRPGATNEWGQTAAPTELTFNCRFVESSKLVRKTSGGTTASSISSQEVVSSAQVFLDKFVDIHYDDTLEYTDEAGNTRRYEPLSIERLRDLGGKVLFTVVNL